MTQRHRGIFSFLKHASVYEAVQSALGARAVRGQFARIYVRAKAGDRVLDIGCGTGAILAHLPAVTYHGYEPNARYVERARRAFPDRGTFHAGYFSANSAKSLDPFDIVILSAVLHHISDAEAFDLFALLRQILRPGGRVVTLDNVIVEHQNPIARLLIKFDRGRHVRSATEYKALADRSFQHVAGEVVHRVFPPSTYFYMTAQ
ncbi:MAG: class I SAM-dependent methyltransferase [Hyphomicrobiales bacterium]|nr:class I SAM-dependent methyltransferase [Acidobacteriaceae bacterium]MBV9974060.1 class I SAM-dependent methyltransferase [Hyphomicrobiales bacterium]